MSKLILDSATVAKLNGLTQQTELYDEAGHLLAYLTPIEAHLHGADLPGPDPFSDQQIEEVLRRKDPGRTLDEIIRDFQKY